MCYFWGKIGALMEKTSEIRKMNRPTNECIFWNKICPLFLPKFQVFMIFLTNLSMGGYSPQRISIYSQIVLNIWLNEGCQKHCIFKLAFYKFTVNSVYSYYCWIQLIFRWIQFRECMMLLYNFMRSKKPAVTDNIYQLQSLLFLYSDRRTTELRTCKVLPF